MSPEKIFIMSFHSMFLFSQTVLWGILFPDIILLPVIRGREQLLVTTMHSPLINGGCYRYSLLFPSFSFSPVLHPPWLCLLRQQFLLLPLSRIKGTHLVVHGQLTQTYCNLTELLSRYHQSCESSMKASWG